MIKARIAHGLVRIVPRSEHPLVTLAPNRHVRDYSR